MNEESKLIELFKKYPGIAARIRRSFAYHYDQIQREIESEVATINKDDAATIIDYNVDEVDMVLYGATIIQEQEKYKPLIMEKFQYYKDNFDEEEHAEEIDYYLNFLEEPETLYTFTEKTINLFKSFIHEN